MKKKKKKYLTLFALLLRHFPEKKIGDFRPGPRLHPLPLAVLHQTLSFSFCLAHFLFSLLPSLALVLPLRPLLQPSSHLSMLLPLLLPLQFALLLSLSTKRANIAPFVLVSHVSFRLSTDIPLPQVSHGSWEES